MRSIFKKKPSAVLTMKITRVDGTQEVIKAPVVIRKSGNKLTNFLKGIING